MRAIEDAAGAAEESKLDEAARLRTEFLQRLGSGEQAIATNGVDPKQVVGAFETYYTRARALSVAIMHGTALPRLAAEVDAMRRERRAFLATLDHATSPDRRKLSAAVATARASQRASLTIDIVVACCVLLLMGVVS